MSEDSRPRSRWKRLLGRFLKIALLLLVSFYLACILLLLTARYVDPPVTTVQLQRRIEGFFRGESFPRTQHFVPLSRISPHLQHAVIAAEDGRFYQHGGIDWQEMEKVIDENLERGRLWRGGSTLTQQLVKNLFLTTHSTLPRKGLELTLTPLCELILPKERILELYLNVVEWGPGVFGAEAAARFHFGVSAARLSREQSARLAACLPAPLRRRPQFMHRYSAEILTRMSQMGW